MYNALAKTDKLVEVTSGAIGRLVSDTFAFVAPKSSAFAYELCPYVVLLENPFFNDPENHPAFRRLLQAVSDLHPPQKRQLVYWWSMYSSERLGKLVGTIQQYITLQMITGHIQVRPAIEVLDLLHSASSNPNYSKLPLAPPTSLERGVSFIADELGSTMDIDDYDEEPAVAAPASSSSPSAAPAPESASSSSSSSTLPPAKASTPVTARASDGDPLAEKLGVCASSSASGSMPLMTQSTPSCNTSMAMSDSPATPAGGRDGSGTGFGGALVPASASASTSTSASSSSSTMATTTAMTGATGVPTIRSAAEAVRSAKHKQEVLRELYHSLRVICVDGQESSLLPSGDIVPFEEFYNEMINDVVYDDPIPPYEAFRNDEFGYLDFPFLLDAGSKSQVMKIDARVQMRSEMQAALVNIFQLPNMYLVLRVRRDQLIHDTLQQLHGLGNSVVKRPLKIKFEGEDGVDEGGVKKEYFQLVVEELFREGYDMFDFFADQRVYWFNKNTFTSNVEFELIGKLLGLAIYNGVILDLRFPLLVYKKLMDQKLSFEDFEDLYPEIARSFVKLLAFDGDVEEVFCLSFEINEQVFDTTRVVELKPGGSDIAVTAENRKEYVDLYIDHLLNKSIEAQFAAFKRGFMLVCGGPILTKFRPEELDLLISGSSEFDFEALESGCRYDDGYDEDSPTIRAFWNVVHRLSLEDKKKLLFFVTGSDRVPIKGLGQLRLTISRQSDSDRLPSSHTCFNHLLIPDYGNEEKLERLLRLAIQNSKGFGLM